MAKASINFKPIKATSEIHNERLKDFDYVHSELTPNNDSWKSHSIADMQSVVAKYCKATSGRKLQKNAEPIREAVVNLNSHHTMKDLQDLSQELQKKFGMQCFQIHIHRDEGKSVKELNYHAHMVFRWQDLKTGKTLKLNRLEMSQIQTLVAQALGMERGEFKENSNRERLEAVEYKVSQELIKQQLVTEKNTQLEKDLAFLEQKKNEVRARIERLVGEREESLRGEKEALRAILFDSGYVFTDKGKEFLSFSETSLSEAINELERAVDQQEADIAAAEEVNRKLAEDL